MVNVSTFACSSAMAEICSTRRLSEALRYSASKWTRAVLLLALVSTVSSSSGWSSDKGVYTRESSSCPEVCSCNSDQVNCSDASLDNIPVIPDSSAKTWILDANNISYLGRDSFGSFSRPYIETLAIRNNILRSLDSDAFYRLPGLRKLHLDWNRISSIHSAVFENCSHLEVLSLNHNPLGVSELDWAFLRPLVSLKILDVSETVIGALPRIPLSFSSLNSLEELTMQTLNLNITNGYFENLEMLETLRTLDLSISNIDNIDEEAFLPLQHLVNLILENVRISSKVCKNMFFGLANSSLERINMQAVFTYDEYHVEPDLFHHLKFSKVRDLNFAGNYAGLHGRIPNKLFHPLKSLKKLHLDDCDLVSLREETFHGLHDLKVLTLRRNQLSCVRGSDCGFLSPPSPSHQSRHPMRHLDTIDLSDNLISEAESRIQFNASFPALTTLILRRNRLRAIPVGMFGDLKKLDRLDLSENPIETIESDAFSSLEALTRLKLDGCRQLSHIKQDTFAGLTRLTHLNIGNSGLVHINRNAFANFSHLEELKLRNNRLGQSHDAIAKIFIQKSNLKTLDLGENDLVTFPRGLLSNSFHLRNLHLDFNRLSDCRSLVQSPEALSQLQVIDLSSNSLVDPSHSCFESLRNLKTIDLSSNPFYCSCRTQDLYHWIQQSYPTMPLDSGYVCAGPESFAGVSIANLGLSSFECYWKYGVVSGVLVCLLGAAVVAILVLCFRQMRISPTSSSRSFCAAGSSSPSATTSDAMEASGPGCSMFLKSTPYAPLDEEELTIRGGIEEHDHTLVDGFGRTGQTIPNGSYRDGAAKQGASNKKSSKCNGFSRAKTRSQQQQQSASCHDEAAMQTCALVDDTSVTRHPVDDDLSQASPCFVTACNGDADHIEDAV